MSFDLDLDFESLLCAVEANQTIDNSVLVQYLCSEVKSVRLEANFRLACIYFYKIQDVNKAIVYAQRAFMLSELDEAYLNLYLEILNVAGDVERKRAVYKEMGCRFCEIGDVLSALRYFNLHRDVYANSGMGDRYEYDFDVLKHIRDLAARSRTTVPGIKLPKCMRRIRIAYLVFGVSHPNSVIIELIAQYARYHDADRFSVVFFILESSKNNCEIENSNIDLLKSSGAKIVQSDSADPLACLFETERNIKKFAPDILVSTAVLADYAQYFVLSLLEGVKKITYCYGPPEQYIPPEVDGVMCPTAHPAIDSICQPTLIPLEFDFSKTLSTTTVSRQFIGLPDDSVVIIAAGRPSKFLNQQYWEAIFATLSACDDAYFIVIGLSVMPPFFSEIVPDQLAGRIKVFGWLDDYLKVLKLADIVVDTFPSGGGIVLLEAMASDIPAVTFQEDYSYKYDQMNWNPGAELVPVKELALPRWDFVALEQKLVELINNSDFRLKLGAICGKETRINRGFPERNVRKCELFLTKILQDQELPWK